ncbi:hypothetical protein GTQ43_39575 [Nostoc sp. KVJ3]|uniref:hypothetical protein n=1 Tax=Nostoc sp. KVJ3 TaxID=457945 RepID=UPI0022375E43|nr:hypothetical protein [Nostoc sp. KVJ3]MCW5319445.1 hypothetical protein [Nostoc sp. KVJ3]
MVLLGLRFKAVDGIRNNHPEYQLLKDSGIGLIIFLHDADDTGLKKLQTCQDCADEVGLHLLELTLTTSAPIYHINQVTSKKSWGRWKYQSLSAG